MDATSEKLRATDYFFAKVLVSVRVITHCYVIFP